MTLSASRANEALGARLKSAVAPPINAAVHGKSILDTLSKRAPSVVLLTLLAALVADWFDAPVALPKALAILVGCLALMLLAAAGRRPVEPFDDQGSQTDKSWLAYELAGKGTPAGFYPLVFFVIVTIVLTGVQTPYALPAWTALCLGIAWGRANASYPVEEEQG